MEPNGRQYRQGPARSPIGICLFAGVCACLFVFVLSLPLAAVHALVNAGPYYVECMHQVEQLRRDNGIDCDRDGTLHATCALSPSTACVGSSVLVSLQWAVGWWAYTIATVTVMAAAFCSMGVSTM